MNAQLAAGAASQGLATLQLQSRSIINGERRAGEGRGLSPCAASDRQPTKDMLGQRLRGPDAEIQKEISRPKSKLADQTMVSDIAGVLHATRGLNLGENLDIVAEPMGQPVKGFSAFNLGGANPLEPKRGHGAKICILPRRAFGIAPDKDWNLQTSQKPQIFARFVL